MHGNENSKHQMHIEEEWGRGQKPVADYEENRVCRSVITTTHMSMQSGSQRCTEDAQKHAGHSSLLVRCTLWFLPW